MKKVVGFAVGTLLTIATSAAWAAGNVAPKPVGAEPIEEIVITAKRLPPEVIEEIFITAKRPAKIEYVRTPPVMAVELQRLEFAFAAPPLVRL